MEEEVEVEVEVEDCSDAAPQLIQPTKVVMLLVRDGSQSGPPSLVDTRVMTT